MTAHSENGIGELIVVSNREPYEHTQREGRLAWHRTDGGLATALDGALRRLGGTWVAWGSGEADREAGERLMVPPDQPAYTLRRVWLSEDEIASGYSGYANQVLWPLCHVTLDRMEYRRSYWDGYRALNERFAAAVLDELRQRPAPLWIHDYQLALLPGLIKAQMPEAPITVFWHVPWPGPGVFRVLPQREALLTALMQADSLIFQTPAYARAFVACAREFLDAELDDRGGMVRCDGHAVRVSARPIGIDVDAFARGARAPETVQAFANFRRRVGIGSDVRIGLGVDRLDYTKGLLKRLHALDHFFTRNPDYRGRFTFLQIAVPTRTDIETYRRYRKQLWETVLAINDQHGDGRGWEPIALLEDRVSFEPLVACYRHADLALVTSVYDGMNLVAKEYVASQVEHAGVVLVSELAGAAEQLTDALLINPYDKEGLADAIRTALEMPLEERERRMRLLRATVQASDIHHWVEGCLSDAGVSGYIQATGYSGRNSR